MTRGAVAHRGWDAPSDEHRTKNRVLPGGYAGGAYSEGRTAFAHRALDAPVLRQGATILRRPQRRPAWVYG